MADVTIKVPKGFNVVVTRDKTDRDKIYNLKVNKSTTVEVIVGEPVVPPPVVTPPPVVIPPPATVPLWQPRFDSEANIRADWTVIKSIYQDIPIAINPQYVDWPEYGLKALRFDSQSPGVQPEGYNDGPSILTWNQYVCESTRGVSGQGKCIGTTMETDLSFMFGVKLKPNVATGMNELGVKLCAFEGQPGTFSLRLWHGQQVPGSNPARFPLATYWYVADPSMKDPSGYGWVKYLGPELEVDKIHFFRMRLNCNTKNADGTWNSDGIIQVWYHEQKVYENLSCLIQNTGVREINKFFGNFYHGGMAMPKSPMTYEFGAVQVSRTLPELPMIVLQGGSGVAGPAWGAGQVVNSWVEIAGSAMSANPPSVNPGGAGGLGAILGSWCGLCIDTRDSTLWSLANGGHTDFYGNQVMKQKMSVNSPAWAEALASDSAISIDMPNNSGYYPSGRPASCHTYYEQVFIEANNRAMRFGADGFADSGNSGANVDGFDSTVALGVNGWDAAGTYPNLPDISSTRWGVCKDASENVYVFNSNSSVRKWTRATNTWSTVNVGSPSTTVQEAAVAFDSTRNKFGFAGGGTTFIRYDVSSGGYTTETLTGDTTTLAATSKGKGLVYVPDRDVYIVRAGGSGGALWSINASTLAVTVLSTTGGSSIPVTPTVTGPNENVYQKFLHAPQYKRLFYVPSYSSNVWAYRYA